MITTGYLRMTALVGFACTVMISTGFLAAAFYNQEAFEEIPRITLPLVLFQFFLFTGFPTLLGCVFLVLVTRLLLPDPDDVRRMLILVFNGLAVAMQFLSYVLTMMMQLRMADAQVDVENFELGQSIAQLHANILFSGILLLMSGVLRHQRWLPRYFDRLTQGVALANFICSFFFYAPGQSEVGYALVSALVPVWITILSAFMLLLAQRRAVENP